MFGKGERMIVCRLQDILKERSMSRRELARRSRLNINTVCKLAKDDHRMIDRLILDRVCTVLQVTPGELLTWKPDQEPSTA
jgi:putative transcriptional regulator